MQNETFKMYSQDCYTFKIHVGKAALTLSLLFDLPPPDRLLVRSDGCISEPNLT